MFRDVIFHFEVEKKSPEDLKPFLYIDKLVVIDSKNIHLYSTTYLARLKNVKFVNVDINDPAIRCKFPSLEYFELVEEAPLAIQPPQRLITNNTATLCLILFIFFLIFGFMITVVTTLIIDRAKR